MRIGILTFHRSYNYGAYLQCFALCNALKREFSKHTVEVIDYTRKSTLYNYNQFSFLQGIRYPLTIPKMIQRRKMFSRYIEKLPLSDRKVISDDILDFEKAFDQRYDIIIVGSDVVWGVDESKFPNPYWLLTSFCKYRLSFAAASHHTNYSELTQNTLEYIKTTLSGFDYIGVRDESTMNFIQRVSGGEKVWYNCDPTVLLPMADILTDRKKLHEKLLRCKGFDPEKKTIGLMMSNRTITKLLIDRFGNDYNIVAVYTNNPLLRCDLYDLDIFEWANIFSEFDLTITTFFHGTLFSIKNNTPVISINLGKLDEKFKGKTEDILTRLEMKEHFFHLSEITQSADRFLKCILKVMGSSIRPDYSSKLEKEAENFKSFDEKIKEIISGEEFEE